MQAQVAFSPLLAAKSLPQFLPAGIHQGRIERRRRQHAAEETPVRFVLGGQRADETEKPCGLRVAIGGRQRRLGVVPLPEIGLEQASEQVFLRRIVIGDASPCDAAFLDEFIESQRARAVALDDLPGGGEDLLFGDGGASHAITIQNIL